MYGKAMRIADEHLHELPRAHELDFPARRDRRAQGPLEAGVNPMEVKKEARVQPRRQYHGRAAAREADRAFPPVVQEKEVARRGARGERAGGAAGARCRGSICWPRSGSRVEVERASERRLMHAGRLLRRTGADRGCGGDGDDPRRGRPGAIGQAAILPADRLSGTWCGRLVHRAPRASAKVRRACEQWHVGQHTGGGYAPPSFSLTSLRGLSRSSSIRMGHRDRMPDLALRGLRRAGADERGPAIERRRVGIRVALQTQDERAPRPRGSRRVAASDGG